MTEKGSRVLLAQGRMDRADHFRRAADQGRRQACVLRETVLAAAIHGQLRQVLLQHAAAHAARRIVEADDVVEAPDEGLIQDVEVVRHPEGGYRVLLQGLVDPGLHAAHIAAAGAGAVLLGAEDVLDLVKKNQAVLPVCQNGLGQAIPPEAVIALHRPAPRIF